jgi:hypothetical protein
MYPAQWMRDVVEMMMGRDEKLTEDQEAPKNCWNQDVK